MTDTIRKVGFTNGIILGVILVAIRSYIYFINLQLLVNVWLGFLLILFFVLFGIISIIQSKKKLGGSITYKDSFSTYFFTLITGHFISCLFLIIISSFVLTVETKEAIKTILTDFNISVMKQNNSSLKDINNAIELSKTYNPSATLEIISGTIKYLLRDSLIGLFVALIFRNKRTN